MLLTVALNYSSSDDLAAAARRLAEAVVRGALRPEDITPARLAAALSTGRGGSGSGSDSDGSGSKGSSGDSGSGSSGDNGSGPGPVDLLIRTSGTQRLSNFLLYECAYAELVFDPAPWPAYGSEQLEAALRAYAGRERRFGGRGGGGSSKSNSNSASV
jgi:undecaprenyl diphosphate synthase